MHVLHLAPAVGLLPVHYAYTQDTTAACCLLLNSNNGKINKDIYDFVPQKKIDKIDVKWFKASEKAIKATNGILNKNTVLLLAADAWRQWRLLNPIMN